MLVAHARVLCRAPSTILAYLPSSFAVVVFSVSYVAVSQLFALLLRWGGSLRATAFIYCFTLKDDGPLPVLAPNSRVVDFLRYAGSCLSFGYCYCLGAYLKMV